MDKPKRKLKGGAEKLRAKSLKNLAADAGKCAKITDMFSGGASGAPSTSGESSTTSTSGQGEGASCSDPPLGHYGNSRANLLQGVGGYY